MNFKKWVKSEQTAGYIDVRTVFNFKLLTGVNHQRGHSQTALKRQGR